MDSESAATMQRDLANCIRALTMDAIEEAKSGHPGMPMGMADVATQLFTRYLKYDAKRPDWPDRDRFVLSAGHGSMLLYALLYLTGYEDMPLEEIKRFRQLGSRTAGHPEYGVAGGIETTTGPLGQGLANGVGMAIAERHLNAIFGDDLVDHRTYVVAGDGCLMEGISQEAITLAGHLRLSRLIVLFDDNEISIDGPTSLTTSEDQAGRFAAAGWTTLSCDGHDAGSISAALDAAQEADRPVLIACKTVIGYGAPTKAGTAKTHGSPLGAEEIAGTRAALGWPHAPFEIPEPLLQAWRQAGARGAGASAAWDARLAASGAETRETFERRMSGALPNGWEQSLAPLWKQAAAERPTLASRAASQEILNHLVPAIPDLLGGSADLTGSNNTKAGGMAILDADNYAGRYLHYGVREHGMAAAMNGMALHGGLRPYGGTFLTFTDYCRPAIRLSALMELPVVYVMTHDSIGLGEDGPTHQPVEHLAALRAIPNLLVLRPCDLAETAEAWAVALAQTDRPSVIALSRQGLPYLRQDAAENLTAYGGYILASAKGPRAVSLIASGSEVTIALEAKEKLEAEGVATAVVSLPSWELFGEQPQHYRDEVLGPGALHIAIEAASPFGWERWIEFGGSFVGMRGFGASAPAKDLYRHFQITPDAVVAAVKARL
ncbi:MAG: transketolase [Rhodospirillales bacterium]